MVTIEFQDQEVLNVRLSGEVNADDLKHAWAALGDERFSAAHDVVVDARGAAIAFSASVLPELIKRYDRLPGDAQGITCFVTDSHLSVAVVRTVRSLLQRESRWRVVPDVGAAYEEIRAHRQGRAAT